MQIYQYNSKWQALFRISLNKEYLGDVPTFTK